MQFFSKIQSIVKLTILLFHCVLEVCVFWHMCARVIVRGQTCDRQKCHLTGFTDVILRPPGPYKESYQVNLQSCDYR